MPCNKVQIFVSGRIGLDKTHQNYIVENLSSLFNHSEILSEGLFNTLSKHSGSNLQYKKIKTFVTSGQASIEKALRSLKCDESAFIIHQEEIDQNNFDFTLALFSNQIKDYPMRLAKGKVWDGLEYFCIGFVMKFNSEGDLEEITPSRAVNAKFRQLGVCTNISLKVLGKIYQYFGSTFPKMSSGEARHVGTVKFYYPLNGFFNRTSVESLRDFDPRKEPVRLDEFEQKGDRLIGLSVLGTAAKSPHEFIDLGKLLAQYELRRRIEQFKPE